GTDGDLNEEVEPRLWGELYGDAKTAAERSLRQAAETGGPMLFILRLGSVYGPGCHGWTERPLQQARRGRLLNPGDGGVPLPYLYIDNMAEAVTAAARSSRPGTYDIFDGVATFAGFMQNYARIAGTRLRSVPFPALAALAAASELLARLTGGYSRLNLRVVRRLRALSRSHHRARGPERAIRELGWSPRVLLDEGMRRIEEHSTAG
ncbi:MAG: NAD-dependent epimerase/dehydratase family protein, partial [Anaerolineales bacterium]